MANLCELSRIGSSTGTKLIETIGKNKAPQGLQKAVEKAVSLPSASTDIAAKASSNYAIGGIVMRDAKRALSENSLNGKVIKLMENPNCSEAELKKLITELDDSIVEEFYSIRKECNFSKESDFERVSQFIKKLDNEIEILKSNPEHNWKLDRINKSRYFGGRFDGYEYNAADMNSRIREYQSLRDLVYDNYLLNFACVPG